MFPIGDHNPSGTFPFVTYLLIGVNVLVFLFMLTLGDTALEAFINRYALIPATVSEGQRLYTLITSMFLHGGVLHVAGNMLFLYIFGDNMEDRLGHLIYLLYYLACGVAASLLQIAIDPTSTVPNLGASGAIAGVMGGYLLLFPRQPIDLLLILGFYIRRITLPAFTMLFYWFIFQLLVGLGSLTVGDQNLGGVAYFAHVGGFLTGLLSLVPFRSRLLSRSAYS